MNTIFTQRSFDIGQKILSERTHFSRKSLGQFLTPTAIALFMAKQLGPIANGEHILDPAVGSGTLLCAVIERIVTEKELQEVWIDGYEIDAELYSAAQVVLGEAIDYAASQGITIHLKLFQTDFVLNALQFWRPSLFSAPVGQRRYQHIIANPPYFKINATDARRINAEGVLSGYTNIYTLFMEAVAKMLQQGQACFIVPRSFCSGTYFTKFRQKFLTLVDVCHIHLFEARDDVFNHDTVLQENVIVTFAERNAFGKRPVAITTSNSMNELATDVFLEITQEQFVSPLGILRIPTSELDIDIISIVDGWPGSLKAYQMQISTGPIVPFRVQQYLVDSPNNEAILPFLWMQHIQIQQVKWPLNHDFHKPQYVQYAPAIKSLLVENMNYVLLRRFSAKEEERRLVSAPYIASHLAYDYIGLENHLNYIYRTKNQMSEEEVIGLSAFLNSGLVDRYFRISNGNTQVNATELRALPLPPLEVIQVIGKALINTRKTIDIDEIVTKKLKQYMLLPCDFPILRETRVI